MQCTYFFVTSKQENTQFFFLMQIPKNIDYTLKRKDSFMHGMIASF